MWVGLLFGLIRLAVLASDAGDSAPGKEVDQQSLQIALYHEKIVQSLILGEYTKSGPYVLETVIRYLYIELAIRADADKDLWFLLALEVNIAMRMGYHGDPTHLPDMSPLKSEMRRRLWATVLLISSQMGMPRMISDSHYDTAEPRNLNDVDLDQATAELPPPRPETETTTTLGLIARRRMFKALGTISDLASNVKLCDYAEVMRVDANLHAASASIPQPFKMKPMTTSITDSPQVIMSRLFIFHLYYKGQITLHRRFEGSLPYSRKACLDASLGLLNIQYILDEKTCPGGLLHTLRWRVSLMINHQFLTATIILCSLLHRGQTLNREEEIVAALRSTRMIWMRSSSISQEARKAAEAINLVLARAEESRDSGIGHGEQDTNAVRIRQDMPAANGGSSGLAFNGLAGLQTANNSITPALLEHSTPLAQQGSDFAFNVNFLENGILSDEWIITDSYGTWK
ncbi:MAG: hypothetical protein Q9166_007746 [cf. Caloplaca sp. 2 TL-2023]